MRWFVLLLFSGSLLSLRAQVEILGHVAERNGADIVGAVVRIDQKKIATLTDERGNFALRGKIRQGDKILVSYIGMKPQQVIYRGQQKCDFQLEVADRQFNEAVVVARQNINALDIRARSGVVLTVDMKHLVSKPMIDLSMALQGSVPGLVVVNRGELGEKPQIRIRGNSSLRRGDAANEPLYVLDGKVISSDAFLTLNPNDLSEIKVLKDAVGTALYGIKAANGVVEITSKRGNNGGKLTASYSLNLGITLQGRRGVRMMDTAEKLEFERRLQNPLAPGYLYSEDYYRTTFPLATDLAERIASGKHILDSLRTINTDWFDELVRPNLYQSHNLSLRGGNDATSYYISTNFSSQGGRLPGNNTHRVTARLSVDQQIGRIGYASVGADMGYSKVETPNGSDVSPTDLIYLLNPYESRTGKLWSYGNKGSQYTLDDLLHQYSKEGGDKRGGLNASLNLRPFAHLSLDAVGGVDFVLNEETSFTPSTAWSERESGAPQNERGRISRSKATQLNWSGNVRITYHRNWKEAHDLTLGANIDAYQSDLDNTGLTGYGVGTKMSAALINQSLTGQRKPSVESSTERTRQLGYGFVGGYSYRNTYDVFASFKRDASSLLPAHQRWNTAWAAGLAWTPSQYAWFQQQNVVSQLNLRASFGQTANLSGVSSAATIATFAYHNTEFYANTRLFQLQALYNPSLKAEHTDTYDASLSVELWRKLTLNVNLYRRQTSNALLDVPIPLSNGFTTMTRNIGVLRNEGYELSANWRIFSAGDLRLSARASLSYNRNRVVSLYFTDRLYLNDSDPLPVFEVGKPYDVLYGLKSEGIDAETGLPRFVSPEGTALKLHENPKRSDFVDLGFTTPPYTGTFGVSVEWKALSLDADFYYVSGGVRRYNYDYVRMSDEAYRNAVAGMIDKTWWNKGDADKTYYTRFISSASQTLLQYANSMTVGRSDYLRLSMLSLRYRIPRSVLRRLGYVVQYAYCGVQASNLFTITAFSESDPETGRLSGTLQPVIAFNLNLTF